jgi:RloB-like protein
MPKRKTSSRSYSPRNQDTKDVKQRFLIVCGAAETEINYFKSFRVPKDVISLPVDPCQLVKKTRKLVDEDEDGYDQVWCVFDRDPGLHSFTAENFNNAFQNAKTHGYYIAYSNECFELWYILHFELLTTGLPRSDYQDKLTKNLGQRYKKNDLKMYEKLQQYQSDAIRNARNLLSNYDPPNPEQNNPSTTVHLLVQALNDAENR